MPSNLSGGRERPTIWVVGGGGWRGEGRGVLRPSRGVSSGAASMRRGGGAGRGRAASCRQMAGGSAREAVDGGLRAHRTPSGGRPRQVRVQASSRRHSAGI